MATDFRVRVEQERIQREEACRSRAERRLFDLIASVLPDADEPFTRADVYAKEVGRVEQYMTDGNGPTAYLCFVFDEDNDMDYAYFKFFDGGEEAMLPVPQWRAEELYAICRTFQH